MNRLRQSASPQGSLLLPVLAVLALVTLVLTLSLQEQAYQQKRIGAERSRLQACYLAEAALHAALDPLSDRVPARRTRIDLRSLPSLQPAEVIAEPFGGFILLRAQARYGQASCTTRAWAGETAPQIARHALIYTSGRRLQLGGGAVIRGSLLLGPGGYRTAPFQGRPFHGTVAATRVEEDARDAPPFTYAALDRAVAHCEDLLAGSAPWERMSLDQPAAPLFIVGHGRLSAFLPLPADRPWLILSQGDFVVDRPASIPAGSRVIAGGTLLLQAGVRGSGSIFYGRNEVHVDRVALEGQFFSRGRIVLTAAARLRHPSVLYAASDGRADTVRTGGAAIHLQAGAHMDGSIFLPPQADRPASRIPLLIGPEAVIRGLIYHPGPTDFRGVLLGTMLTARLTSHRPPTRYDDWLVDAAIDHHRRPPGLMLPVGFGPAVRLRLFRIRRSSTFVRGNDS